MKPVIGLLLVFTGLAIGYMVITGKLPSGQSPTPTGSITGGNVSGGKVTGSVKGGTGGGGSYSSQFPAYRGII